MSKLKEAETPRVHLPSRVLRKEIDGAIRLPAPTGLDSFSAEKFVEASPKRNERSNDSVNIST